MDLGYITLQNRRQGCQVHIDQVSQYCLGGMGGVRVYQDVAVYRGCRERQVGKIFLQIDFGILGHKPNNYGAKYFGKSHLNQNVCRHSHKHSTRNNQNKGCNESTEISQYPCSPKKLLKNGVLMKVILILGFKGSKLKVLLNLLERFIFLIMLTKTL